MDTTLYRVSFRQGDLRKYVHLVDDSGFVHFTWDEDLFGVVEEESLDVVVRCIIGAYGPARITIDPVTAPLLGV